MLFIGLAGMRFEADAVRFEPLLPPSLEAVDLAGVPYRHATLEILLRGRGNRVEHVLVNGHEAETPSIPADATGVHAIAIALGSG
jgi:cellobiose phosphorylase